MLSDIDWGLMINILMLFLATNFLYYDLKMWKGNKSLWNGFLVVIMTACVALYVGKIYYGETTPFGDWVISIFSN